VYLAAIANEMALGPIIFIACQTIQNRLGAFERVRQFLTRHTGINGCVDSAGGYFEHLL